MPSTGINKFIKLKSKLMYQSTTKNNYKKTFDDFQLLLDSQEGSQKELEFHFSELVKQNSKLLDLNKALNQHVEMLLSKLKVIKKELKFHFSELVEQNSKVLDLNKALNQQVEMLRSELKVIKKERNEKAARKKAWSNPKHLPKRDPINSEIYNLLIKESEGPGYIATRTRIALCLLTVTGIQISELLPLKVGQLETLLEKNWISIDRLKKGPANHKAFLTSEGKKMIKARKKDFESFFVMKDKDSFVFTSDRKPNQMLRRETLTMDINRVLHSVSKSLSNQFRITSHSFRVGYISQLWKDTKDIEFVKQSIGNRRIETTSFKVEKLSNQERSNQERQ